MLQSVRWTKVSSAFAMVAVCVVGGCVQTQTDGKPKPRPLPPAPKNAVVAQVQVFPGQWADTDSNGYGDSLIVTAYLWSDSYQLPVTAAGTFEFVLEAAGGKQLGAWTIEPAAAAAATRQAAAGPAYVFELSLLERGGDVVQVRTADLRGTFTPEEGRPLRARSVTMRVGKLGP